MYRDRFGNVHPEPAAWPRQGVAGWLARCVAAALVLVFLACLELAVLAVLGPVLLLFLDVVVVAFTVETGVALIRAVVGPRPWVRESAS